MKNFNIYELFLYGFKSSNDEAEFQRILIGFTGFYYAAISCDNKITDEEERAIKEYIKHVIMGGYATPEIQIKLFEIANYNTNLDMLIPYLDKISYKNLIGLNKVFDYLINIKNNGKMGKEEKLFSDKWLEYLMTRIDERNAEEQLYMEAMITFCYMMYESIQPGGLYKVPDELKNTLEESLFGLSKYELKDFENLIILVRGSNNIENNEFMDYWENYFTN